MSRATLLPTPGDPFLVAEWLRHWRTWGGVGGQLYVGVSWPQPEDVVERIRADVEQVGGVLVYDGEYKQHGANLRSLIDLVQEEYVLFVEDDLYVRTPGQVEAHFRDVEGGRVDVVGLVRGNGTQELMDACRARGWWGTGVWPHLLFAHTEEIRSLTQTFDSPVWQAGDVIVGLDYRCREFCCADTFHAAALELWGRGIRFANAVYPSFDQASPWFHIGSLSSGPELRNGLPVEQVLTQPENWAPRVAWWGLCADRWPGGLDDRHAAYREQVRALGDVLGWERVHDCRRRFDQLVVW